MRSRNDFGEPVALDHRNQFVHYNNFFKKLNFTANAGLSSPLAVWRDDIATLQSLPFPRRGPLSTRCTHIKNTVR
jgi:hypothetical protein